MDKLSVRLPICLRLSANHRRAPVRLSWRIKNFGWFGDRPVPIGSLFVVAGIIESVLGLLITIGLFTSYAAFIASVKWPSLISSAFPEKFLTS